MLEQISIDLPEVYNTLLWFDSQFGTVELVARSLGWVPVILFFFYSIYQLKTGIPFGALDIIASNQHWWNYFLHGFFFGGFALGALVDAFLSSVDLCKNWKNYTNSKKRKELAKVTTKWLIAVAMTVGVVFSFLHHYSAMKMFTISSHVVGLVPGIFLIGLSLELLINGANLVSSIRQWWKAESDDEKAAARQELFKATINFAKTSALMFFVISSMILLSNPGAVLVVAITLAIVSLVSMLWDNVFEKSIKDSFKQSIPGFSKKERVKRDNDIEEIPKKQKGKRNNNDDIKTISKDLKGIISNTKHRKYKILRKILKPYVGKSLYNDSTHYAKYEYPNDEDYMQYLNFAKDEDLTTIAGQLFDKKLFMFLR